MPCEKVIIIFWLNSSTQQRTSTIDMGTQFTPENRNGGKALFMHPLAAFR